MTARLLVFLFSFLALLFVVSRGFFYYKLDNGSLEQHYVQKGAVRVSPPPLPVPHLRPIRPLKEDNSGHGRLKLEKILDSNRQTRQLEELTEKSRDCKRY